jgi:hypothetical protein
LPVITGRSGNTLILSTMKRGMFVHAPSACSPQWAVLVFWQLAGYAITSIAIKNKTVLECFIYVFSFSF